MNKSPLTSILTGVLALSALASLILCYQTINNTHEIRALRIPATNAAMKRNVVLPMLNDVAEYSKTHPSILPVLQAAGLQITSGSAAAAKPR